MKRKDIDKCVRVNLSSSIDEIMQTVKIEMPVAKYFLLKKYGGKHKAETYARQMLDKALERKVTMTSDICEYISPKGNRWLSYIQCEYHSETDYAFQSVVSFIYYETYGSCGAFFPIYTPDVKAKEHLLGIVTFTSHFFLRMSERTNIPFRSSNLIKQFISTMQMNSTQVDDDGKVMMKFVGGYGYGKQNSKSPIALEIKTYLNENQLSPSQKKMAKMLDSYATLMAGGTYDKDAGASLCYKVLEGDKDAIKMANKKMKAIEKLGIAPIVEFVAKCNYVFVAYLSMMGYIDAEKISSEEYTAITLKVSDCFVALSEKYYNKLDMLFTQDNIDKVMDEFFSCCAHAAKELGLHLTKQDFINIDKIYRN